MEPEAKTTIPTLNQSPKSKPNNVPAIIRPRAIKNPMVNADFKKEKSFLVIKTMAESPVKRDKVNIAAWYKILNAPPSATSIAIKISGMKMKASATTYNIRPA